MEPCVARILDANRNRAAEALRVLEDYARFGLDDADLTGRIKQIRHDLFETLGTASFEHIVRSRDIAGDVGRDRETETEYRRRDARDVAAAAAQRAAQALRVLEEYAKIADDQAARRLERLRYATYAIENAVVVRDDADDLRPLLRLYVIMTESLCSGPWLETARLAIRGGATCIQLREKTLSDGELLGRAREMLPVCRESGVPLIVNDRPDVARLAGADGVHVGQDDLAVAEVRRIVDPISVVGLSTHTFEQARTAMTASPDYIAVGPMFPSETKPQAHVPGPDLARAVRAETSLPVVAIGGIGPGNVEEVVAAGADGVCVCSAVIAQRDVGAAAADLKDRVGRALERRAAGKGSNGGD